MDRGIHTLFDSRIPPDSRYLFTALAGITLACLFTGILSGWYWLAGIPFFFVLIYWTIVDFRKIFWILLASIPVSTEVYLPNGLGTDLPTEPLMIGLMLVGGLLALRHAREWDTAFLRHPLTLLLAVHLAWIFIATLTSGLFIVSLKFLLAKVWYVATFFFLGGFLLRTEKDLRTAFWVIGIPLLFSVVVILIRHAGFGFSFSDVHKVLAPFQRNHVNYAATLALFFPWIWFNWRHYRQKRLLGKLLLGTLAFVLVAIYLSYTRAAYAALAIAAGAALLIHWRMLKVAFAGSFLVLLIGLGWMADKNHYLDWAPNYDRTISHKEFDNLLEATYKLEDISTMERLYRWIAGIQMSAHSPLLGYGPGNFVNFYESYTVKSFQTYVSDNPERSGIHSYFLMTLVEQGLPGLAIFLVLSFGIFAHGQRIYAQAITLERRRSVLMILLSLVVIYAFLLINDLIETDKVGSFFFISIAVLINADLANRRDRRALEDSASKPSPTAPAP